MDWIEASIRTTTEGIESVCGCLYNLGITGVRVQDKQDFLEFISDNNKQWDFVDDELMQLAETETLVICYITDNSVGYELLNAIKAELVRLKEFDCEHLFGALEIELKNICEEDWANNWKKHYKPFEIGSKLLIKPEWESDVETERVVLNMNPGNMFGTGTHQSTQMCLEFIDKLELNGADVFDVGCGSGILSIAALLLGANSVVAIDIDKNVHTAVSGNLKSNNISIDKYKTIAGNILDDEQVKNLCSVNKYQLICANIVADVIIAFVKDIKRYIANDGKLICSGIIFDRKDDVVSAIEEQGLKVIEIAQKDDWIALLCDINEEA